MVMGCISTSGVGDLVNNDEIINVEILSHQPLKSILMRPVSISSLKMIPRE